MQVPPSLGRRTREIGEISALGIGNWKDSAGTGNCQHPPRLPGSQAPRLPGSQAPRLSRRLASRMHPVRFYSSLLYLFTLCQVSGSQPPPYGCDDLIAVRARSTQRLANVIGQCSYYRIATLAKLKAVHKAQRQRCFFPLLCFAQPHGKMFHMAY